jgi:hypothetical protein
MAHPLQLPPSPDFQSAVSQAQPLSGRASSLVLLTTLWFCPQYDYQLYTVLSVILEISCVLTVHNDYPLCIAVMFSHSTATNRENYDLNSLKGQSNEIWTPVFFTKRLVLVSIDMSESDFEFCQIFVELFVLKISKY